LEKHLRNDIELKIGVGIAEGGHEGDGDGRDAVEHEGENHVEKIKRGGRDACVRRIHIPAETPDGDTGESLKGRLQKEADLDQLGGADAAPHGSKSGLLQHRDEKLGVRNKAQEGVIGFGGEKAVDIRERNTSPRGVTTPKRFAKDDIFAGALKFHEVCSNRGMGGESIRVNAEMAAQVGAIAEGKYPTIGSSNNTKQSVKKRGVGGH
jgi:hypothetical protein